MKKILLKKGQKLFVTSDTHYNHTNICKGVSKWDISRQQNSVRDFNTLYEMNSTIVNNINTVVGEDDILIHLGDVAFSNLESLFEFRNKINCKNIHLVYGNHDEKIEKNRDNCQDLFLSCDYYLDLTIIWPQLQKNVKQEKHSFILFHYPIASWNRMGQGMTHLFGHIHSNPRKISYKSMDVGMDGNNFKPYNIKEIIKIMNKQEIGSIIKNDHHV